MMKYVLVAVSVLLGLPGGNALAVDGYFTVENVQEVVSGKETGKHNAFPSIAYYKDRYYLAYREADNHLSKDGVIKVYTSGAAGQWRCEYTLYREGFDMRDGMLAEVDGRLLALSTAVAGDTFRPHYVDLSSAAGAGDQQRIEFKPVKSDIKGSSFMFSVARGGDDLYGFVYTTPAGKPWVVHLQESSDGINWRTVEDRLFTDACEANGIFHDGKLWAIARGKRGLPSLGVVSDLKSGKGESFRFNVELDAPCVFRHDGRDYVIGRAGGARGECGVHAPNQPNVTALFEVDWENHKLEWVLNFPHGHGLDNAYASIAPCGKDRYLVAYYASGKLDFHNSKPSIWVATLVYDRMK